MCATLWDRGGMSAGIMGIVGCMVADGMSAGGMNAGGWNMFWAQSPQRAYGQPEQRAPPPSEAERQAAQLTDGTSKDDRQSAAEEAVKAVLNKKKVQRG